MLKTTRHMLCILLFCISLNAFSQDSLENDMLYSVAVYKLNNKLYDDAINNFNLLIQKDPNNAKAYIGRAKSRFLKYDTWHTAEELEKSLSLQRGDDIPPEEINSLMIAAYHSGKDFQKALELDHDQSLIEYRQFADINSVFKKAMEVIFGGPIE